MIPETQTKKSPSIMVIALGLICIILAASTIAAFTLKTNDTTELDKKDKKIEDLNAQIVKLTNEIAVLMQNQNQNPDQTATINSLNNRIATLNEELAAANKRAEDWRKIVNLEESELIVNKTVVHTAGDKETIYHETMRYASYIVVEATPNSTDTCYIEVSYTYNGSPISFKEYFGKANEKHTLIFPVLPASLRIVIGNDNDKVGDEDAPKIDNKVNVLITLRY
ncbi:hypothetical protein [Candidatus Bathycorpusculum sp.]|uniref:coiled-coil domain-containing protein n=1 Tax=Candidatus Bathycorpusculum sp. TaxID=2994959 RepID=UPI002835AB25|nr:hypothetical protein [Candidatus Termitimicrobium sp.]MCL2686201.1 hypothetical protein [Candidatus Termitimicrobium sp.]